MSVIANTSVLIALSSINRLNLLKAPSKEVMVPKAVMEEYGEPLPKWVKVIDVKDKQLVRALLELLHKGEAETIALAIEVKADIVILDDKKARSIAKRIGLRVIGTLGVLMLAKKKGLINDLSTEIEKLVESSFRLSQDVIIRALKEAKRDC